MVNAHHIGATPSTVSGSSKPAPERIGPYRVRGVLGEGGFGVVYLAEQEEPVRRQVAIKLLRAGRENEQVVARFQRERQSLAWMEHPGIARVYEAAELADGRPYIVMELVNGLPITSYCDQSRLSVRGRLGLVQQVCRAVQHAHTKGMIHRDLKPSNVLVAMIDGEPVVKIIDFGIAKPITPHDGEQTVYTQLHQIVGTPGYMAPEQVAGDLGLDTRADVYAIGVMMYELLAGCMPLDPSLFKGKTAAQAERIITEMVPPRPSTRVSKGSETRGGVATARGTDPEQLSRTLRGELDWVVMKCLEKSPGRRYQSPASLEADVERFLRGEAVEAVPPSLGYRMSKFARRNRALVGSGVAIVIALSGGLASAAYGLYRAEAANAELTETNTKLGEALEEVTRQERVARREASRSGAFSKLFIDDVLGAANPTMINASNLTIAEVLDKSVLELDKIEEVSVRAAVEGKIGEIYRMLSSPEKARVHLESAVQGYRSDPETSPMELSVALLELARVCAVISDYAASAECAREAYEIRLAELSESDPRSLYAAQIYASQLQSTGRSADAVALIEQAYQRAVAGADAGPECREQLLVMSTYAQMVLMPRGLGQERYELMRRVIEMAERLGVTDFDMARYLGMFAEAAAQNRKLDESAELSLRAIEMERRVQGRDTESVAGMMGTLANTLRLAKRYDEAEAMAHESIELYVGFRGKDSERVAGVTAILAAVMREQKRYAEAEAALARTAEIYAEILSPASWRTLNVQSLRGEVLIDLERYSDAERVLLDAERGLRLDANARRPLELTIGRLMRLYETTGNAAERDRWSDELKSLTADREK